MDAWNQSVFWDAFADAGLLVDASLPTGVIKVGFARPDTLRMDGLTRSTDYEIEYQHADAPGLAEGDAVEIGGSSYRVRETPHVTDNPAQGSDGTWRRALLTKV